MPVSVMYTGRFSLANILMACITQQIKDLFSASDLQNLHGLKELRQALICKGGI